MGSIDWADSLTGATAIDWTDFLKGATAIFLVLAGVGLAYACIRLGGLFGRLSKSVGQMTDEVVPILTRAQTTVDGINLELIRVDDIMVSAVNATKGAERTVTSITGAVAAPVRKASGLAAMAKEALATFRTRRSAGSSEPAVGAAPDTSPVDTPRSAEAVAAEQFRSAASEAGERFTDAVADAKAAADARTPDTRVSPSPPPLAQDPFAAHVREAQEPSDDGAHGPSRSQIEWALPKKPT